MHAGIGASGGRDAVKSAGLDGTDVVKRHPQFDGLLGEGRGPAGAVDQDG